jgi:hypothetical protein
MVIDMTIVHVVKMPIVKEVSVSVVLDGGVAAVLSVGVGVTFVFDASAVHCSLPGPFSGRPRVSYAFMMLVPAQRGQTIPVLGRTARG